MGKLNKSGLRERKRIFGVGMAKGHYGKKKSELSLINAMSQIVADSKRKKRRK